MSKYPLTVFSSKGRLTQVDFANNASFSGNPVIGLKTKNGVTIITSSDSTLELGGKSLTSKIFIVSRNIGITGSGLHTDLRLIVKKARKIARKFQNNFGENISVKQLLKELSIFIQEFTHTGGVRPFGTNIFIFGFDTSGPNLFQVNSGGSFFKINSGGIGKNSHLVTDFLKKRWNPDLNIPDCVKLGLMTFQESSDSLVKNNQIKVGVIDKDCVFFTLREKQIEKFIKTLKED